MGLGKTIMSIALMAEEGWKGTNLIVTPVNVIRQWHNEI
jgi:SNF2 family DNA or RNA helicase